MQTVTHVPRYITSKLHAHHPFVSKLIVNSQTCRLPNNDIKNPYSIHPISPNIQPCENAEMSAKGFPKTETAKSHNAKLNIITLMGFQICKICHFVH